MEMVLRKIYDLHHWLRSIQLFTNSGATSFAPANLLLPVKNIGIVASMGDYEKRKLRIFNLLNFLQFIVGIGVPIAGILHNDRLPLFAWQLAFLPAGTSLVVLLLNYLRQHEWARLIYFILYPFLTCIVYLNGMNTGVALHFILFGVLSVFFLKDIGYMLFTVGLSMVSYYILDVVLQSFLYEVRLENNSLYLINQALALLFIFYGLYLVKRENTGFQYRILRKNKALHKQNIEIQKQNDLIAQHASLLDEQKRQLSELDNLKTKLFSVIAHDLKSPMYAIRNLFQNMHRADAPAENLKAVLPEVLNELNYTIGLMDNMLHWAKSQMMATSVVKQKTDINKIILDVLKMFSVQAEAKTIHLEYAGGSPVYAWADGEMIHLVLRNLVSNAIKFTAPQGTISLGVEQQDSFVEVFVQDNGTGMTREVLQKINENNFFTTKGTSKESGTGLGLMLCREFLQKNGGRMFIESEPGAGSVFSFTLPVKN